MQSRLYFMSRQLYINNPATKKLNGRARENKANHTATSVADEPADYPPAQMYPKYQRRLIYKV